jgi:hypothetical protein
MTCCPNNLRQGPARKSALPANVVAKMNTVGQRKAISMTGMSKRGVK